jgi:hypothetical protein
VKWGGEYSKRWAGKIKMTKLKCYVMQKVVVRWFEIARDCGFERRN